MKTPKTEMNLVKNLLLSMRDGEESWFKVHETLKNDDEEPQ